MKTIFSALVLATLLFGSVAWVADTPSDITTDIVNTANRYAVGTDDGRVYAFSGASGQSVWNVDLGSRVEDLEVWGGDILAATREGTIARIRTDGVIVWIQDLRQQQVANTTYGVVPAGTRAYLTTDTGIWEINAQGNTSLFYAAGGTLTPPMYESGYLASGINQQLVVFRPPSKTPIWTQPVGTVWTSAPVLIRNKIVLGSLDNNVYAFEAADGFRAWKRETGGWITTRAMARGDDVFIGSHDGRLYALRLDTGETAWEAFVGQAILTTPVEGALEARPVVLVGSQNRNVWAFDQANGRTMWQWESRDEVTALDYQSGRLAVVSGTQLYVHELDRACTISSPSSGTSTGTKNLILTGYAFPVLPGTEVQISVNGASWETVARGGGEWRYELDSDRLSDGSNILQCQVVEPGGAQEEPFLLQVFKDSALPPSRFILSYPLSVEAGAAVAITIYDGDTLEPVEGYRLEANGETYTGDMQGAVTLTAGEEDLEAVVRKKGFQDARITIAVARPASLTDWALPVAGVLILVVGGGYLLYRRIKKPKPAEQGTEPL